MAKQARRGARTAAVVLEMTVRGNYQFACGLGESGAYTSKPRLTRALDFVFGPGCWEIVWESLVE